MFRHLLWCNTLRLMLPCINNHISHCNDVIHLKSHLQIPIHICSLQIPIQCSLVNKHVNVMKELAVEFEKDLYVSIVYLHYFENGHSQNHILYRTSVNQYHGKYASPLVISAANFNRKKGMLCEVQVANGSWALKSSMYFNTNMPQSPLKQNKNSINSTNDILT